MTRETDAQRDIVGQQLIHDRDMRAIERIHGLISQGAKGLCVLGGSAAVGVFAFIQALIEKHSYLQFKPYAVAALCFFLVAAFLPVISFFFQYKFLNFPYRTDREKQNTRVWWLLAIASALLLIGGGVLVAGISLAL